MAAEKLKNRTAIRNTYKALQRWYFNLLTCVSPTLNTKARYRAVNKKPLNLNNPETFSEKLLWLKLNRYMDDPLVIQCADKFRVREYVRQCGCGELLNELYGVYDSPQEIPWEQLPEQFVLKWNFGAGMNIICRDKSQLERNKVIAQMEEWKKSKCWISHSEMQYKHIPRKIVCERFLTDGKHKDIPDYKVYCFHGEPLAILVMQGRGTQVKAKFFDEKWNELEGPDKYSQPEEKIQKPACLDELLSASKKLSVPFPFVRCDFYIVDDKAYFGELTFTPAGGLYMSQTVIDGKDMAEFLNIDCN